MSTTSFRPGVIWNSDGDPPEYFVSGATALPVTNARLPTPAEARRHRLERFATDFFFALCEASGWTGSVLWRFPDRFPEAWDGSFSLEFRPPGAEGPVPASDGLALLWAPSRDLLCIGPDPEAKPAPALDQLPRPLVERFTQLCEATRKLAPNGLTGPVLWWLPANPAAWDGSMILEFLPHHAATGGGATGEGAAVEPVGVTPGTSSARGLLARLRRLGLPF